MNNPSPSIATGPATPITGCYHTQWCDRDSHRAGSRVMCLYAPDNPLQAFTGGEIVTLSDCWAGLALRRLMSAAEVTGTRFARVEDLQ